MILSLFFSQVFRVTLKLDPCYHGVSCYPGWETLLYSNINHWSVFRSFDQAGHNDFVKSDYENVAGTWGLHHHDKQFDMIRHKWENNPDDTGDQSNSMPERFDARLHWFQCESIGHIWNQGNCAADWVRNRRCCLKLVDMPKNVFPAVNISGLSKVPRILSRFQFCLMQRIGQLPWK